MTPAITVAIAACGRPEPLLRCVEAVQRGTRRPDVLIVVDQDPSAETERRLAASGPVPVCYLAQERRGLSASRNLALSVATTTVLAVTDDDCVPDPGWVAAIAGAFAVDDPPSAVSGAVLPLAAERPGTHMVSARAGSQPERHSTRLAPWRIGTGGNFAAQVGVLRDVGGWDERLGTGSPGRAAEDIELIDRLMRLTPPIAYEPEVVVRHELRDLAGRLSTRSTYGFGIGAFLALRARRRDAMALPMAFDYVRMHGVSLANALVRRNWLDVRQHARALAALAPGAWYGIRLPGTGPATDRG